MRRLIVFDNLSLDGSFSGPAGEFSWAHRPDPAGDWTAFVAGNAAGGGALVLGRVTYEIMASYWPTPLAAANDPAVAAHMNGLEKIVFSRTLRTATWSNTRIVAGDLVEEMRRLKREPGADLVILGSGSLVAPLAAAGLIDEFQVVVHPVALGGGRSLFLGLGGPVVMRLLEARTFGNGNVLLRYAPEPRN